MLITAVLATSLQLSTGLTDYPRAAVGTAVVEAVVDRGPIQELIVRCPAGKAILSYSKVERLFCGRGAGCGRDLPTVVQRVCR